MNIGVLIMFGLLILVGAAIGFTNLSSLYLNLRLFFKKTDWHETKGTIINSSAELVNIPANGTQFVAYDIVKTIVELQYTYSGQSQKTMIEVTNKHFLAYKIEEAKQYMASTFPTDSEIVVFVNANDIAEIEIDERKITKKKLAALNRSLFYILFCALGIAMFILGLVGLIITFQKNP